MGIDAREMKQRLHEQGVVPRVSNALSSYMTLGKPVTGVTRHILAGDLRRAILEDREACEKLHVILEAIYTYAPTTSYGNELVVAGWEAWHEAKKQREVCHGGFSRGVLDVLSQ